jgi:hypothetical protein
MPISPTFATPDRVQADLLGSFAHNTVEDQPVLVI